MKTSNCQSVFSIQGISPGTFSPGAIGWLVIAVVTGLLSGCGGTNVGPGKTEVVAVAGTLYYADGTPASNATASIAKFENPFSTNAKDPALAVKTSPDGAIYLYDTLEDGFYSIVGESGDLRSFSDSVLFVQGKCDPINDTLKQTGSVTGMLQMRGTDDPRSVLVLLSLIEVKMFLVDNLSGVFTIDGIPQGTHPVRFFVNNADYPVFDTVLTFISGVDDTLPNSIELPYRGVVPITGFHYVMDTLMRSVTIKWDKVTDPSISHLMMEWVELSSIGYVTPKACSLSQTQSVKYLEESPIMVRMQACNDVKCSETTPWLKIQPVELCSIVTIRQPVDSIQAVDLAVSNEMIYILGKNHYVDSVIFISKYDYNGTVVGTTDISLHVRKPQAMALAGDTVIVLDGEESLLVHRLLNEYSTMYAARVPVPEFNKNILPVRKIYTDSAGGLFITSGGMLYKIDAGGVIVNAINEVNPAFAITRSALYCITGEKMYELGQYDKQTFVNTAEITFNDETVVTQSDISVKALSVNNNGVVCCLLAQSLYVFSTEINNVVRLFVYGGNTVVGMQVTDSNHLFILYNNARIDRVDLNSITGILKK